MAIFHLVFLSALALLMPASSFLLEDTHPCKYHKVLKKSPERSVSHVNNNPTLCDKDLDGWYRFEEGEIATTCVPDNHCNENTIWMNDTFPKVSEGIQTKNFCAKVSFFGLPASSCCEYKFTVRVLNCGEFMTYQFLSNYLSGSVVPCPIGYCTDTIPKITSTRLIGPLRSEYDFHFQCIFDYEQINEPAWIDFEVKWLFNKTPVSSEVVSAKSHIKSVTSNQRLWMNHFGESLSCSVLSYHHGSLQQGIEKHSDEYFGGIKIEPQPNALTEGHETEVTISSTLPILCNNYWFSYCSLVLSIDNNNQNVDFTTDKCAITLISWPKSVTSTQTLRIRYNNLLHLDKLHKLSLQIQPNYNLNSFWQDQRVDFKITTKNTKNIACTVFPDCHVFGFDKTRVSTIEYPGDFLLYNSSMDIGNQLEIHVRQMILDGETPSTCGVAMRYGDEIVFLDICTYKTVPVITRNSKEERLSVSECGGNLYLMTASNGARVHVQVYKSKLSILLYGPLQKSSMNTDLCSFEAATSSPSKQDLLLFRLDRSTSFFRDRGRTAKVQKHIPASANCSCNSVSSTCRQDSEVLNFLSKKKCNIIKATNIGSTLNSEISEKYDLRHWTWPTKSGRLQNSSLTACQFAITNGPPKMCFYGLITYLHLFNKACLENTVKTDSTEGHLGIVQAFTWFCQTKAFINTNQSQSFNVSTSEITTDICPNFCSLNGICSKGICHCNVGYTAEDCSVTDGTETSVVRIIGGETCALSTGRCLHPTLLVNSSLLLNQTDLYVNVIPIIFNKTVTALIQKSRMFPVQLVYDYATSLDLTSQRVEDRSVYGYRFFLFRGGWYSNDVDYVIYDDKCRICSSSKLVDDAACTIKGNSCHIDNHCHTDGEVSPDNPNLTCNPNKSQSRWSHV